MLVRGASTGLQGRATRPRGSTGASAYQPSQAAGTAATASPEAIAAPDQLGHNEGPGALAGAMPAKVSESIRPIVMAGFAKLRRGRWKK